MVEENMLAGYQRHLGWRAWAGLLGISVIVGACSGTAASPSPATTAAAPRVAASEAAPSARAEAKTLEIAYLSFAVAHSYDAPTPAPPQAAAASGNPQRTGLVG